MNKYTVMDIAGNYHNVTADFFLPEENNADRITFVKHDKKGEHTETASFHRPISIILQEAK